MMSYYLIYIGNREYIYLLGISSWYEMQAEAKHKKRAQFLKEETGWYQYGGCKEKLRDVCCQRYQRKSAHGGWKKQSKSGKGGWRYVFTENIYLPSFFLGVQLVVLVIACAKIKSNLSRVITEMLRKLYIYLVNIFTVH